MAFQPSQYTEYSDASSAATALAPLVIDAGTKIATTAIEKGGRKRKRHPPKAPPPPPPSALGGIPMLPLVLGGLGLLGVVAVFVFRPKRAAPAAPTFMGLEAA